jgi:hypothetical protein
MVFRLILVCFVAASAASLTHAGDSLADLEKGLSETRKELRVSEKKAAESNVTLLRFKDRAVYKNPEVKKIYLEMKALEKEILLKREKVNNAVMKLPEYRELLKKRNDAYKTVREQKGDEKSVMRAIKSLRAQAGEEKDAK